MTTTASIWHLQSSNGFSGVENACWHEPSVPERFALHMKRTRLNLCLFGTWDNTCGKDKDEVGLNDTKVQPILG